MNRFILLAVLLFAVQAVTGKDIAGLKLRNKLSILNGRAYFNFPDSAKNIARGVDIMSADPNADRETRIVLDIGEMRMVFFATDIHVLGDKNLLADVRQEDNREYSYETKMLSNKDSLISVLCTPTKYDSTKNAILVNRLLVKTPEGAVFEIMAYINPAAYKERAAFRQLSEKVFSGLSKGARRIALQDRTERFDILGGNNDFLVKLPAGFVVSKDAKYDFQVLKLYKFHRLNDTGWLSLTIYTGFHPSTFYPDHRFKKEDATMKGGKFLDTDIEWLSFYREADGTYLREQILDAGAIQEGLMIHIAMLSNSERSIDELAHIVKEITLEMK